jgi:uncharacterized repeat protein (TIGR01451 family)
VITIDGDKSVTATFTLYTYTLSVSTSGNGAGAATSQPAGIDCGSQCSATFDYGTVVTLTAVPGTGSSFAGWSGDCTGTGDCVVTLDGAKNVTALFTLDTHSLTLGTAGNGAGVVNGDPSGTSFDYGTVVTLTAAPAAGSYFAGWAGDVSGTDNPATIMVDGDKVVTATFTLYTYTLSVNVSGNGAGSIQSDPAGIGCSTNCASDFDYGTVVTLTATPATGSTFTGWTGACSGTAACVVTVDGAKSVGAEFTLIKEELTVGLAGNGSGSVDVEPSGTTFDYGTVVTLTAVPAVGSHFAGWSGDASGTDNPVTLVMDGHKVVTATFTLNTYDLSVEVTGNGSGNVTSEPAAINCGDTCTASFEFGTVVTLTAAPSTGSTFAGWEGDCTGTGPCIVTVSSARNVTASFTLIQYTLTVTKLGNGSGSVTSAPSGLDCGADCGAAFDYGTVVTLTAAAETGSTFMGWQGACGGTLKCVVTMNQAASVTATFTLDRHTLTVHKAGDGTGVVASLPAGLNCGVTCTAAFDYGTLVTLTATADSGSVFTGWSGDCEGTGVCVVNVEGSQSVTATFALVKADLWVRETYSESGIDVTFTIVAGNSGPSNAPGAIVSDTLPVQLINPQWACRSVNGAACPTNLSLATSATGGSFLHDTLSTFPAGGVVTYTITGRVNLLHVRMVNGVEVIPPASVHDPVMANNHALLITNYNVMLPVVYSRPHQ